MGGAYDEGIARYRLTDFADAVDSFEDALTTVPPEHECDVRINLVFSHESVGDAAMAGGEDAKAGDAWRAGVATLARGGCLETNAHPRRVSETAGAVLTRLTSKVAGLPQAISEAGDGASGDAPAGALNDRNDRGERIRRRAEQRQQDKQDQLDQARPSASASPPASPSGAAPKTSNQPQPTQPLNQPWLITDSVRLLFAEPGPHHARGGVLLAPAPGIGPPGWKWASVPDSGRPALRTRAPASPPARPSPPRTPKPAVKTGGSRSLSPTRPPPTPKPELPLQPPPRRAPPPRLKRTRDRCRSRPSQSRNP